MFTPPSRQQGATKVAQPFTLPPPVGGLNASSVKAAMPSTDAYAMENWIAYPDRVETRGGASDHVTGFSAAVKGLHVYASAAGRSLWATTDSGIYNASSAGAVGAVAIALTSGATFSVNMSTGGTNVLFVANGVDTLKKYDGTTWTSVATFGTFDTTKIGSMAVYKTRLFMGEKNSLIMQYLPVNSVSGSAVSYDLGSLFAKGGYIRGIATWTIDAGDGADDKLVVITSEGEVAVFSGGDPAVLSDWSKEGVYDVGTPLGVTPFTKVGGDLLVLTAQGLLPLSSALQTASIDRSMGVTDKISGLIASLTAQYRTQTGWGIWNFASFPLLVINVPGYPGGLQLVMHGKSKAWSSFTGWAATAFAWFNDNLYFATGTKVAKGLNGTADFGSPFTATFFQAYSAFTSPVTKRAVSVAPILQASGNFNYSIGFANDFKVAPSYTTIISELGSAALWGTAVFGSAKWTGDLYSRQWRTPPDEYGTFKALYFQVQSGVARISYQGCQLSLSGGGQY